MNIQNNVDGRDGQSNEPFPVFTPFASAGDAMWQWPTRLAEDLTAYWTDAAQRTTLFLDLLRQRGDEQAGMTSRPLATVLTFDHEIIMGGSSLPRPINFSLARVIPPADAPVDVSKRPVVIVDPRAGQGPGIGGFHYQSEIGDAFAAGHQVYFIGFSEEPVPGQTFLDVVEGQVAFFERIIELHPDRPLPFAVGNCQAGYQTLMVAMLRPDLFGPVMLAGSPMSYWQGVHGKNPMRYTGGLLGGTWSAALASDLGNGRFDGAYLIGNFDLLNPANTFFEKLYHVYSEVDTEGPRFLGFEKWWGDLVLLNGEEIQYLADQHFVGNKLTANEIATDDGRRFDIRSVTSPIIVFTSLGDNISPPQQTLGWILDLYGSVDDIRNHDQTIVYCVDPKVGHLAIFVSKKVAAREDDIVMRMINLIDVLPPGLYELIVTPKTDAESGDDDIPGDFVARFEARTLDDIRRFGCNSKEDDRAFATVARWSEITLASYRTFFQPFVRSVVNEQTAEVMRAIKPERLQYALFTSHQPWMSMVAEAAEQVRNERNPVATDNPFRLLEQQMAAATVDGWNRFRDVRDRLEEWMFFSIYGSPFVQAVLGTAGDAALPRHPPPTTPAERTDVAARIDRFKSSVGSGDALAAKVRALLFVIAGDHVIDERLSLHLHKMLSEVNHLDIESIKQLVRTQFFVLQFDREEALRTLPKMVPEAEARQAMLAELKALTESATRTTPEMTLRLETLERLLRGGTRRRAPAKLSKGSKPAETD